MFQEIPKTDKREFYRPYKTYLENLAQYLKEFFMKTQPLADLAQVERQINQEFELRWKDGTLKGWERQIKTVEQIIANPLYCKFCKKLFKNDNNFIDHKGGKKHKKNEIVFNQNNQQDDYK